MHIEKFLENRGVWFEVLDHKRTYTAANLAKAVHTIEAEVAKPVLLRADDGFVLAVLPASRTVDFDKIRKVLGAERVELASEVDCGQEFLDCELGARMPFGSQYGLPTVVDSTLLDDEQIVFEGNTHRQAIRMKLDDFVKLEQPLVAGFTHPFR